MPDVIRSLEVLREKEDRPRVSNTELRLPELANAAEKEDTRRFQGLHKATSGCIGSHRLESCGSHMPGASALQLLR